MPTNRAQTTDAHSAKFKRSRPGRKWRGVGRRSDAARKAHVISAARRISRSREQSGKSTPVIGRVLPSFPPAGAHFFTRAEHVLHALGLVHFFIHGPARGCVYMWRACRVGKAWRGGEWIGIAGFRLDCTFAWFSVFRDSDGKVPISIVL